MLLALLSCAVCPAQAALTPEPPTALVLDMIAAAGAQVQRLHLRVDPSLHGEQGLAIEQTLRKSALFELVTEPQGVHVLDVRRLDAHVVLAHLSNPHGTRVWVGQVTWADASSAPAPASDDEAILARVQRYQRDSLRVQGVVPTYMPPTVMVTGHHPRFVAEPMYGWGFATGVSPAPSIPGDWVLLRGAAEVLDDRDLAELLNDAALQQRIDEERFWPRLYWYLGFGLGGAALTGTGLWMTASADQAERDRRSGGYSLLALGVVGATLAILRPWLGDEHVLTSKEAEQLVDQYNAQLRREIGVTPADLQRFK